MRCFAGLDPGVGHRRAGLGLQVQAALREVLGLLRRQAPRQEEPGLLRRQAQLREDRDDAGVDHNPD